MYLELLKNLNQHFAYFILDRKGMVKKCKVYENFLINKPQFYIGKHFSEFLPLNSSNLLQKNLENIFKEGTKKIIYNDKLFNPNRTNHLNEYVYYKVILSIGIIDNFNNIELFLVNESEIKYSHDKSNYSRRLLNTLNLTISDLHKNPDIQRVIVNNLPNIGRTFRADRAYVFKFEITENENKPIYLIHQLYEWSSKQEIQQISNPKLQNLPVDITFDPIKSLISNKFWTSYPEDLPDEIPDKKNLIEQEIKSILLAPIFVEDSLWGFIGLDHCQIKHSWLDFEIEILNSLAINISNYILLFRAKMQLENLNDYHKIENKKNQSLINKITHEIRTPLHGVVGNLELLNRDGESLNLDSNIINDIITSSTILSETIDNITFMSKEVASDQNQVNEISNDFYLNDVINNVINICSIYNKVNKNSVSYCDKNKPIIINAHLFHFQSIVLNIFSNASKYTYSGLIKIKHYIIQDQLIIKISDTGIGIPKKERIYFSLSSKLATGLPTKKQAWEAA